MEPGFSRYEPVVSASEEDTRALGRSIGRRLRVGDVVALYGTLGAGKSQFVKGVCEALGISSDLVHSPTFTLVNEYAGPVCTVYHFDAYRVEQVSEFFELGYETYFYGDGICLVEWPDRIEPLLPAGVVRIRFTHLSETSREVMLVEG
jgi:tRNA threonylcarbamoyladenosine biosynthesis protein TsaE